MGCARGFFNDAYAAANAIERKESHMLAYLDGASSASNPSLAPASQMCFRVVSFAHSRCTALSLAHSLPHTCSSCLYLPRTPFVPPTMPPLRERQALIVATSTTRRPHSLCRGGRALLASRTILPSSHARLHMWRGGSWRDGSPWNAHDRQSPKPLRFSLVTTRFAPGHRGQDERVRAIL